ncbi:hypothetical protein BIW11_04691 [Tropilaelaps mercedesae]|uniref:Uncharacterized protein n=1 Tax=Tropilaelaps mercedesae TaxID=418985 RepID=A0A1V9X2T9_9ACAR|nr:hypothetical protein BIW11_04691 [Tropilaelaps mercedesae]
MFSSDVGKHFYGKPGDQMTLKTREHLTNSDLRREITYSIYSVTQRDWPYNSNQTTV